jgi:exodeoxyribonuclease X
MMVSMMTVKSAELAASPFVVVDCETTGVNHERDRVIEFAMVRFRKGLAMERFSSLVDPEMTIPTAASAVNQITDRDIVGKPTLDHYRDDIIAFAADLPIVAHNAGFDRRFLTMLDENRWICSYRLARRLWGDLEKHTNAFLRYHFDLGVDGDLSHVQPHRAESDALVTGLLFLRELRALQGEVSSIENVRDLSWNPIMLKRLFFGKKHWGWAFSDIPTGYLNWLHGLPLQSGRSVLDADTLATVEIELASRLFPQVA